MSSLVEALVFALKAVDRYVGRRLFGAVLLVAFTGLCAGMAPVALKWIVDTHASNTQVLPWAPLWAIGAYVLSQSLFKILGVLRQFIHNLGWRRLYRYLNRRLVAHVFDLPLSFHVERKTGAVSATLQMGMQGYATLLEHFLYTFLPVAVEFSIFVIVLVHTDHSLYLWILCAAAIGYFVTFGRAAADIAEPSRDISKSLIDANDAFTDSLLNYETVKFFGAESVVVRRNDSALQGTELAWRTYYRRVTTNSILVVAIFGCSLLLSLILASREVTQGTMTVGELVLINSYVLRLVQPLEQIGYAVRDIAQGLGFLEQMLALTRQRPELDDGQASLGAMSSPGKLEFESVHFSYRADPKIFQGMSFTVPAGKRTALVGATGSGKSTTVKLAFRLYDPQQGRILLDDRPIAQISLAELRQRIAVVPQDAVLFNDSVYFNIAFGKNGATWEEVEWAARIAHLHDFILSLPQGYETVVGERGVKLSGGERQRIAIARAVIKRPQVFIFDEATSSLDSVTEQQILSNLDEISQGCTTLTIAHRLSTIAHADQILVMENGSIVERGTHAALLHIRNGRYASMWCAQQSGIPGSLNARVDLVVDQFGEQDV